MLLRGDERYPSTARMSVDKKLACRVRFEGRRRWSGQRNPLQGPHPMKNLSLAAVLFLAAAASAQQHPCFQNLVPNGDFALPFPDPWTTSGPVTGVPDLFTTNGVETTFAYKLTHLGSPYSLRQPTPLQLQAGVTYEFSADVWSHAYYGRRLDVGLTEGTNRTVIGSRNAAGVPMVIRVSFGFTVASSKPYLLDLTFTGGANGEVTRVDNVVIRPARIGTFTFQSPRGSGANNTCTLTGPPNAPVTVFLSGAGFSPVAFPIPTCGGEWLLALPAVTLFTAGLDNSGQATAVLSIPAHLRGAALYWQAVVWPPTCNLGCPVMIGFP